MRKKKLSLDRDACFSEIPRAAASQVATRHSLPLSNGSKGEKRGQSTARLLTEQNVTRSPFSWPYRQTDQGVRPYNATRGPFGAHQNVAKRGNSVQATPPLHPHARKAGGKQKPFSNPKKGELKPTRQTINFSGQLSSSPRSKIVVVEHGELLAAEAGAMGRPNSADLREVGNYVAAVEYGLERLDTLPLSLRLIREIHERLMRGVRGDIATPGEFRRSQNWALSEESRKD